MYSFYNFTVFYVVPIIALWFFVCTVYYNFIRRKFSGPLQLPVVGSTLSLDFSKTDVGITKMHDIYGINFEFGFKNCSQAFVTKDLELIKSILVARDDFPNTESFRRSLTYQTGPTMFTSEGADWQERHRVLTPLMNQSLLQKNTQVFCDFMQKFLRFIPEEKPFNILPLLDVLTFDFLGATILGIESNLLTNPLKSYRGIPITEIPTIMNKAFDIRLTILPETFWGIHGFKAEKKAYMALSELFTEAYTNYMQNPNKDSHTTLVHQIVSTVNSSTDTSKKVHKYSTTKDIFGETLSIYMGGHDSTVFTSAMTLQLLAANPQVQKKLQKEIDLYWSKYGGKITYETLSELEFLECVIKETLRMHPFATVIIREPLRDTAVGGIQFKKGSTIFLNVLGYHLDKTEFPEPHVFKPERWNSTNSNSALLTFGMGTRMCFGKKLAMLEIKVMLINILHRFTILEADRKKYPIHIFPRFGAHLRDLWLVAIPRNKEGISAEIQD